MMKRAIEPGWIAVAAAILVVAISPAWACAQQEPAVLSGVQYLKGHYGGRPTGESAMIALALLKAEVPPTLWEDLAG